MKKGFTLIELLVVVLIIGILAAIALPQYQKAVRKSRLSEVAIQSHAYMKGVDLWLLENGGFPSEGVYFSGNEGPELDISVPCTSQDITACQTKLGQWTAYCASGECQLNFSGTSGKIFPEDFDLHLVKFSATAPLASARGVCFRF